MEAPLISRKLSRLARFAAIGSGLLLLASAGLMTAEILMRRLFHHSLVGVDELAGYAFAVAMAWGFAHALFMRAHIRVDLVYLRLPARVQRWLDVLALGAFAGIIGIVVSHAWGTLAESLRLGARASTPLATPLWMPQAAWLAGLIFFLICLIALLFDLVRALARGDRDLAAELGASDSGPRGR
ncbi:TRAP transporter small permease subunit [Rhodovulum sp. MB263]|uniref:TRAP transporter small permease subunit n=1 Tax=Rhodovulum sp. (strain MB263) TaxID=308754 RepID=UPI0009B748B8|nr:TRAP transporter small permease [Rhodovulum sp. MB263]ARC90322.1 hypothetical protein B5V46_17760 [Rhodovulum sp. MB263]